MDRAVVLVPVATAAFWSRACAWGQQGVAAEEALGSSQGLPTTPGKSLFVWDSVVGLRGLELPTKRLSAVSSDH
jgi:hypothetical protein